MVVYSIPLDHGIDDKKFFLPKNKSNIRTQLKATPTNRNIDAKSKRYRLATKNTPLTNSEGTIKTYFLSTAL